jgi:pimeloyl-ACP methyl ester carboxylesterase
MALAPCALFVSWPAQERQFVSQQTLDIDGVRIVYDITGDGPPVLLLHGGAADSTWWGELVPALEQTHTVIQMDSRGHGRSSFDDRQLTYRRLADDALALLDHLGFGAVDLVGWSDGGIIAIDIALRQPERLNRVVAFGANFDLSGFRTDNAGAPPSPAYQLFSEVGPQRYSAQSPHPDRQDELLENLYRMWTTEPNWTHDEIRSIQTPILVLDGIDEESIDIDHARLLADLLPNGTLTLIPNAGHFAMVDQPAAFTRIIVEYLASPVPDMSALP